MAAVEVVSGKTALLEETITSKEPVKTQVTKEEEEESVTTSLEEPTEEEEEEEEEETAVENKETVASEAPVAAETKEIVEEEKKTEEEEEPTEKETEKEYSKIAPEPVPEENPTPVDEQQTFEDAKDEEKDGVKLSQKFDGGSGILVDEE